MHWESMGQAIRRTRRHGSDVPACSPRDPLPPQCHVHTAACSSHVPDGGEGRGAGKGAGTIGIGGDRRMGIPSSGTDPDRGHECHGRQTATTTATTRTGTTTTSRNDGGDKLDGDTTATSRDDGDDEGKEHHRGVSAYDRQEEPSEARPDP
jgi:hypothetical protein